MRIELGGAGVVHQGVDPPPLFERSTGERTTLVVGLRRSRALLRSPRRTPRRAAAVAVGAVLVVRIVDRDMAAAFRQLAGTCGTDAGRRSGDDRHPSSRYPFFLLSAASVASAAAGGAKQLTDRRRESGMLRGLLRLPGSHMKLLIANRAEIAIRIARAAAELEIPDSGDLFNRR